MRLVKIKSPAGMGSKVMQLAFDAGIDSVSFHQVEKHRSGGRVENNDVVDIETSTPKANSFMDKLITAEFFDRDKFSFNVREPRSIGSSVDIRGLTVPLHVPPPDIYEELWQFNRITYGLVGRIFLAACLLAYGLIQHQILLMISGILFLPLLQMVLAIGYGAFTANRRLLLQGLAAIGVGVAVMLASGAIVAAMSQPPMRFNEFNSLPVSMLISAAVGVAAGLGTIDDTGRRELIGLAAASQIGLIPTWLGVCLVFGLPPGTAESEIYSRILMLVLNVAVLSAASGLVFWLTGTGSIDVSILDKARGKSKTVAVEAT